MLRPILALSAFAIATAAWAQSLPPGPKITITAVTQLSPALPQYKDVDVPMLREKMPAASNGRIEFNLKSYPAVLPNWVKRCGARCGEIFNDTAAPLTGAKYRAN